MKQKAIIGVLGCMAIRRAGKGERLGSLRALIKTKGFLDHGGKNRHGCLL